MLKTEERLIGRYVYRVSQLGFTAGRQMLVRLTKALGPVLARMLEGASLATGKLSVSGMSTASVAGALYELAERLTEADLEYACAVFGMQTVVVIDGRTPQLDKAFQELHFAGAYDEMIKWLGFCLEVNYSGFTSALGGLSAVVPPVAIAQRA